MFAVECFAESGGQGVSLGELNRHADPRHGLQQRPVQAQNKGEHEGRGNFGVTEFQLRNGYPRIDLRSRDG